MKLPSMLKPKLPKLPGFLGLFKPKKSKNAVWLLLIVWLVFMFFMWRYGESFDFAGVKPFAPASQRWLITLMTIVGALFWAISLLVKANRQLRSQQRLTKQEVKDPTQIEVNTQQRYLERWLINLHKQFSSKAFQYKLPWYLVIGEQQSGKTTFLKEGCKLNALYQPEQEQRVHCWLNDQATIIEADGVLFNHSAAPALYEKLWQNVLSWLVETRTEQPLNGLILTIDLYQISTFTQVEKERYITLLKSRFSDIERSLHAKLPVYLVFTKLDLFYGFGAVYQNLDKEQREDILGITFDLDNDWRTELDQFWQRWLEHLNSALPSMMLNNVDINQRSQLFTFTRQISGIREVLKDIIDRGLFSINQRPVTLRGLYLTSSEQQGQMEDLFVKSASSLYNLPEQIYPSWQTSLSYTYFTHDLLNNLLFKEVKLAGKNEKYLSHYRHNLYRDGMIALGASVLIISGWHYFYSTNYRSGEDVLEKAKHYIAIELPDAKDYLGNHQLPLLNPVSQAAFAYGDYNQYNTLFSNMGLYQGHKIGPYVEATYQKLLLQRFLPALMNGLERQLNNEQPGSDNKLKILRIMRMLEDESGRDNAVVMKYMAEQWSKAFNGQNDIQSQLEFHLAYALNNIDWKKRRTLKEPLAIQSYLPYEQSISDAQVDLRQVPIYRRVYQNLHSQAKSALPNDLNLRSQVGASFDSIFTTDNERLLNIPQLLTRSGLMNYFIAQDETLTNYTSLDSWVLGITENTYYSDADRLEIQRQIASLYLNDYISTWHNAYNNIHIRPFKNIPDAISGLEQITGGEYVFKRTIDILKENTTPKNVQPNADAGQLLENTANPKNKDYQLLNYLSHQFTKENSVLIEDKDQISDLGNVQNKLIDLHRYMMAIQNSPSPGKSALQAVQLRLTSNGSDPIFEIQQMSKTLPEPLGRWLNELANETWNVVMIEAIKSLEIEWNEKVVTPYQQLLAQRYPFSPNARLDAPLSDFERFFNYDGTLDAFYKQNLKAFIDHDMGLGSVKKPLINPNVLKQLELAERIRRTYFNKQSGLGIQFSIQPINMSGNRRRGVLNLDGQLVEYRHASSIPVRLIWPNSMRDNVESKLTLIGTTNANQSLTYTSPWGLLKMINSGKLTNVTNSAFDVRYDIGNGYIIYRVYIDESDNPFAGGLFNQFNLPNTLY